MLNVALYGAGLNAQPSLLDREPGIWNKPKMIHQQSDKQKWGWWPFDVTGAQRRRPAVIPFYCWAFCSVVIQPTWHEKRLNVLLRSIYVRKSEVQYIAVPFSRMYKVSYGHSQTQTYLSNQVSTCWMSYIVLLQWGIESKRLGNSVLLRVQHDYIFFTSIVLL